jgi:hypothetical protein
MSHCAQTILSKQHNSEIAIPCYGVEKLSKNERPNSDCADREAAPSSHIESPSRSSLNLHATPVDSPSPQLSQSARSTSARRCRCKSLREYPPYGTYHFRLCPDPTHWLLSIPACFTWLLCYLLRATCLLLPLATCHLPLTYYLRLH